jgi:hypothetical protein
MKIAQQAPPKNLGGELVPRYPAAMTFQFQVRSSLFWYM